MDNYTKIGTCMRCNSDVIHEYGFPVCTNDECDYETEYWRVQIDDEEVEFPTRYEAVEYLLASVEDMYPKVEEHDSVLAFELRAFTADLRVHNLGDEIELPDGVTIRLWLS